MNKTIALLALAVLCLATVYGLQRSRLAAREAEFAKLNAELQDKVNEAKALEAARQKAENQKGELVRATEDLAQQVQQLQLAAAKPQVTNALEESPTPKPAAAKAEPAGLGGFLSKMMSDPETKKLIRNQQRAMMDQLYKPLIKQLGLSSDQAEAFKDLLADNMMKGTEKATSLFGSLSSTNRSELASTMAAEQKSSDEQIKAFLGEQGFATYKDYQETAGERMQLNAFRQQNDAGEYPLNDIQVEQLLALMKDEKRNTMAALGTASSGPGASMENMLSPEQSDKFLAAQETANQHVFEKARTVLSPDQLRSFGTFQANQLQMMRAGMNMARKLIAPQDSPPAQ